MSAYTLLYNTLMTIIDLNVELDITLFNYYFEISLLMIKINEVVGIKVD